MKIIVKAIDGPSANRKTWLRPGQAVSFGYSSLADFIISDNSLAPVHFRVACSTDDCELLVLDDAHPTKLNHAPIASCVSLAHGDLIEAGSTTFHVQIDGADVANPTTDQANPNRPDESASQSEVEELSTRLPELAVEVAQRISLPAGARLHLNATLTSGEYLCLLRDHRCFAAAVNFLAHGFQVRASFHWACRCLREIIDQPQPTETDALNAVEQWIADPTADNASAAAAAAERVNSRTPAGLLALAASWRGDLNDDAVETPVPLSNSYFLIAQAVTLAAVTTNRDHAHDYIQRCINLGLQLSSEASESETLQPEMMPAG